MNSVNRNIDPTDPTQGRRRECLRRQRQRARQHEKALAAALRHVDGTPRGFARALVMLTHAGDDNA